MSYIDFILLVVSPYTQYMLWAAYTWLGLAIIGTLALYVGYGFAMSGKRARDEGRSQTRVVYVDVFIALWFIVLDAVLNIFVFSVLCLDFRPKATFTLVTGRLCLYNLDPNERAYRKWFAHFFAAFLDGKDPSGDHVKGDNFKFKWLD